MRRFEPILFSTLLILYLAGLYALIKSLAWNLPLAYYDDSETLYHVLNILKGRVPYLEDHTHHFIGYVFPFLIGAKIFGLSTHLIPVVSTTFQVLSGLGIFYIVSKLSTRTAGILGASLYISAREPWVLGFFPQYEINFFIIYAILTSIQFHETKNRWWICMSFFLCGLSFVVDQRAGLLILIPALTFTLTTKKFLSLGYIFFFLPILAFLIYLNKNHALIPFYEQTLLYPSKYRSGSSSLLELLKNGILANKYLYLMSPILLISGMVGFLQILHKAILHKRNSSLMPIIFCFIPCFVMPFFGNRDYEYYSIPWLVLLSISTALSPALFSKRIVKLRNFYSIILCLPVFISLRDLSVELGKGYAHANSGDGVHEVVSFLKNKMSEDDTIYVWGYRLDIYVYLKKLSPFPDAAQLMIHPDSQILDEEARRAHVFDKYEERFLEDFKANLPTFLVLFDTTQAPQVSSRANALVRRVSQTNYRLVFKSRKRDFIENDITFEVYERHSKVLGTDSGIQ